MTGKKDYVTREEFDGHQRREDMVRDYYLWVAIFGAVAFSFVLMMAALGIYYDNFARDKQLRSLELARYNFTEEKCVMWTAKTESLDRLNECVDAGCLKYKPCQLYCHTRQVPEMDCREEEIEKPFLVNGYLIDYWENAGRWRDVWGHYVEQPTTRLKCEDDGDVERHCISVYMVNETVCAPKQECKTIEVPTGKQTCKYWCLKELLNGLISEPFVCRLSNEWSSDGWDCVDEKKNETTCTPITRAETYGCQDGELVRKSRELFG